MNATASSSTWTSVADHVRRVIAERLCVDAQALTPQARFRYDLGADSLDAIDLLMAFEEEFGIEISDRDAGTLNRVEDAIQFLESRPRPPTRVRPPGATL